MKLWQRLWHEEDGFWNVVIPAVAAGISAYMQSRNQNNQNQLTADQMKQQNELEKARLGLTESTLDPYRGQMYQQNDLARLDAMANSTSSPTTLTVNNRYAKNVPQVAGGFDWQPSDALKAGAKVAQRSVAAGDGAPSVVPGANGAQPTTSTALNLSKVYADPTGASGGTGAPTGDVGYHWDTGPQDYENQYDKTTQSDPYHGISWGKVAATAALTAAGTVSGGASLAGAALTSRGMGSHKAAPGSVTPAQAEQQIVQAYRTYLNRDPTKEDVAGGMHAIGYRDDGANVNGVDAWVNDIKNSAEAQRLNRARRTAQYS